MGDMTLRTLSPPLRVLFTCFLLTMGLGYLAAGYLLFLGTIDPHQKMGMAVVTERAARRLLEKETLAEDELREILGAADTPSTRAGRVEVIR